MKIAVFGAGAIGGHMAARLSKARVPVSLVARGAHLEAIRKVGLSLLVDDECFDIQIAASDKPSEFGIQDYVIVSVKGPQLPDAIEEIRPLVGEQTRILFAMNGLPWWFADGLPISMTPELRASLDPAGNFGTLAPANRTIWGVITSGSAVVSPGVIRSTTPKINVITLGYPDDRIDEPIRFLTDVLGRAGYTASIAPNIREAIWSKLLTNAAQAMVATVTNRNHFQVTSDSETRAIIIEVMRELITIGESIGLHIAADPIQMTEPARFGTHISSFLQDLRGGRPLELSSTILAARDISRAKAIAAPHLTTIAAIVAAQSADAAARRQQTSGAEGGSNSAARECHRN